MYTPMSKIFLCSLGILLLLVLSTFLDLCVSPPPKRKALEPKESQSSPVNQV